MTVHLVNPSHLSFGVGVITPRWLFVLAAATPAAHGRPQITDETLEPFDVDHVQPHDVVGIGIHTGNALRGYEIGTRARARGANVIFGGIHATLYPDEAHELGGAHAVVRGRTRRRRSLRFGALGFAAAEPLHVGLRADSAGLSEALFILFGVADRWSEAAAARGRCGGRRNPRTPSPGISVRRAGGR